MNELIIEDTETARIYAAVVNALGDGATTEEVQAIVRCVQSVQRAYALKPEALEQIASEGGKKSEAPPS